MQSRMAFVSWADFDEQQKRGGSVDRPTLPVGMREHKKIREKLLVNVEPTEALKEVFRRYGRYAE